VIEAAYVVAVGIAGMVLTVQGERTGAGRVLVVKRCNAGSHEEKQVLMGVLG